MGKGLDWILGKRADIFSLGPTRWFLPSSLYHQASGILPYPLLHLQPFFSGTQHGGSSSAGHFSSWSVAGVTRAAVQRQWKSSRCLELEPQPTGPTKARKWKIWTSFSWWAGSWPRCFSSLSLALGPSSIPPCVLKPAPGAARTS